MTEPVKSRKAMKTTPNNPPASGVISDSKKPPTKVHIESASPAPLTKKSKSKHTDEPAIQLTIPTPSEIGQLEQELLSAWQAYQKTEKYGLEFGRLCYERCEQYKAQGSHKGLGFETDCSKLGINRRTAYRWKLKWEISIGLKKPKDEPPTDEEIADQKEIDDAKREEERLWAETYSKEYALRRTAGDKDFDAGDAAEKAADAAAPDADESKKLEAREAARKEWRAKQNAIEDNVPATCPDCHRTFLTQTEFYEHDCPEQKEPDSLDETPVFNNTDNTVDAPDAAPAAQDGSPTPIDECYIYSTFHHGYVSVTIECTRSTGKGEEQIILDKTLVMTTHVTGEKQARDTDPKASQYIRDAAQSLERKLRNMNLWNVDTEKEMSKFIEDPR